MNFDVVIIGGGLVGASLAAALGHSGLSLALVESQPLPAIPVVHSPFPNPLDETTSHSTRLQNTAAESLVIPQAGEGASESLREFDINDWDSRIYAISPGCRDYLEKCGAWSLIDPGRIAPVAAMRVFGDAGAELDFSAYETGVADLASIVESRTMQRALWQVLQRQENLTLFHPARCAALKFGSESAELTLEDGRILSTRLIVGADGRDSWVRNQAGITAPPHDYLQHGVVANFACEREHRNIAHQWFQPDGILALLPLPGNRVSMVWSVSPEQSAQLVALPPEELGALVASAARNALGELKVITPAAAFPLRLLVLPQISAPRLALIGDAAHNMHPLAGQGVNTGFRDARELAETLLARGAQGDCGDAQLLRGYERRRKEDIYLMQAATYGLKHLFNNDNPLLRKVRNLGLNTTNQLAMVKKLLIRHALN